MHVSGEPPVALRAVEDGVGHHLANPGDESITQRASSFPVQRQILHRRAQCGRHRDDAGRVGRAGPDVTFVTTTVEQRHARDLTAQQQGSDALRAPELVRGDTQGGQTAVGESHW